MPGIGLQLSEFNETGWGPPSHVEEFKSIPIQPFNKADNRLGKVADWTQNQNNRFQGRNNYNNNNNQQISQAFGWANADEEDFKLVDNRPTKPKQQPYNRQNRNYNRNQNQQYGNNNQKNQQQQNRKRNYNPRDNRNQVQYKSSVDIRSEWQMIDEIQFVVWQKLFYNPGKYEDLYNCGAVEYYDKNIDKISSRQGVPLKPTSRVVRSVTTSDDPIMRRFAEQDQAQVFVTDQILTTIMCATRSTYSWDILITRVGNKVFFDKRYSSSLDFYTVNESAAEPVSQDQNNINGVTQLSLEATAINQNFSQQALDPSASKHECEHPNPFVDENSEDLASTAYKYRKWQLGKGVSVIVRCEYDAVINVKDKINTVCVKALNEVDTKGAGLEWPKKLESQKAALLALELKNNGNKLAKWVTQAILVDADMLKLGFVTRAHSRDNHNHLILGTQGSKPKDFAAQMNLNTDNCWAIVQSLVDRCMQLQEGKYLLLKDPNKPLVRLYSIPDDTFVQQEAVDNEDEDQEDDGQTRN